MPTDATMTSSSPVTSLPAQPSPVPDFDSGGVIASKVALIEDSVAEILREVACLSETLQTLSCYWQQSSPAAEVVVTESQEDEFPSLHNQVKVLQRKLRKKQLRVRNLDAWLCCAEDRMRNDKSKIKQLLGNHCESSDSEHNEFTHKAEEASSSASEQ